MSKNKVKHKKKSKVDESSDLYEIDSAEIGPLSALQRREAAYQVRKNAASYQKKLPLPSHPSNGDEDLFPNKIGNYSKGLPHNNLGLVDQKAYKALIKSLSTGDPENFASIPMGGSAKLSNPQSAYAYDLVGPDSHHLVIIEPPAFSSSWIASEAAEVYWQALTRDVPFSDYDTNELTLEAASDLSTFSDFRGPKEKGKITTGTLFRGNTPGDKEGPYISQFLWKDIPYGPSTIIQRYRTTIAGDDHLTLYDEWLNVQNGVKTSKKNKLDPTPRFIRNGRDLSMWVHQDFTFQSCLNACLILLSYGKEALNETNPYNGSTTEDGFITFGGPHILDLISRAARSALSASWFQKWLVHRRLRPEEFGGHLHNHMTKASNYPINKELTESKVISHVFSKYKSYLLPLAYPEGCPTHPSYPAGHACIVGAGVTMMKAFFKESFVIPAPVESSSDGLSLLPYDGSPLTIGGELNKLASNISIGRDTAGVHWRSDGFEGLKLGEAAAIGILQDFKKTYNENFAGFSFRKFDGTKIMI